VLFYEYFHGDNGAGIVASHQTGWTALIALLTCYFAEEAPPNPIQSQAPAQVVSAKS
jgi:hypothetical protein